MPGSRTDFVQVHSVNVRCSAHTLKVTGLRSVVDLRMAPYSWNMLPRFLCCWLMYVVSLTVIYWYFITTNNGMAPIKKETLLQSNICSVQTHGHFNRRFLQRVGILYFAPKWLTSSWLKPQVNGVLWDQRYVPNTQLSSDHFKENTSPQIIYVNLRSPLV
jgi:hypothetical protein